MENNDIIAVLDKCNFWTNPPENLGYYRKEYLTSLISYLDNHLIKVLVGQRRVGKSFILRQLIDQLIKIREVSPTNILYLNMEYEQLAFIQTKKELSTVVSEYLSHFKPNGKVYLFFDEIQEVEGWEKCINSYLADAHMNVEIFLTGSNSILLSSELATYISGRYVTKEIYPYSYADYLDIKNQKRDKASLLGYLDSSGIPEMYNLQSNELQRSYLRSLKDTILLKDVVKRYHIQDVDLLERIFMFLVDNIGSLFSINALVNKLKSIGTNTNTITLGNYLRYIENAFLIFGVDRYDIKGKRILEGEKKYYLTDLGFRNWLTSSFDTGSGKKLENYLYLFLKGLGYQVYVGNLGEKEVDFVAEKPGRTIYIQVAYLLYDEKVVKREYSGLETIKDNWEKIVVTLDDVQLAPREGIKHVLAWNLAEALR